MKRKLMSCTLAALVAVCSMFCGLPVQAYAAPTEPPAVTAPAGANITSSAVQLIWDVDVPDGFRRDITVTVENEATQETYDVTAHYVGGHRNTVYVPSGHYKIVGVNFNANGDLCHLTIDPAMDSDAGFDVGVAPVTITGQLVGETSNVVNAEEQAFQEVMADKIANGETNLEIELGDDCGADHDVYDEHIDLGTHGMEAESVSSEDVPQDEPVQDGITRVLSTVAFVLVVALIIYVLASIGKAIQKRRDGK